MAPSSCCPLPSPYPYLSLLPSLLPCPVRPNCRTRLASRSRRLPALSSVGGGGTAKVSHSPRMLFVSVCLSVCSCPRSTLTSQFGSLGFVIERLPSWSFAPTPSCHETPRLSAFCTALRWFKLHHAPRPSGPCADPHPPVSAALSYDRQTPPGSGCGMGLERKIAAASSRARESQAAIVTSPRNTPLIL